MLHVASPRMLTNCETGEEPAEASIQITNIEYVTYICHLYLASLISLITTVIIVIRIIDKCMYDIWYTYCKIYYMIYINKYIYIYLYEYIDVYRHFSWLKIEIHPDSVN